MVSAAAISLEKAGIRMKSLKTALSRAPIAPGDLDRQWHSLNQSILKLNSKLYGNRAKRQIGEKQNPTINTRLRTALSGARSSTYGPTAMHKRSFEIAVTEFNKIKNEIEEIVNNKLPELEKALQKAGAPIVK